MKNCIPVILAICAGHRGGYWKYSVIFYAKTFALLSINCSHLQCHSSIMLPSISQTIWTYILIYFSGYSLDLKGMRSSELFWIFCWVSAWISKKRGLLKAQCFWAKSPVSQKEKIQKKIWFDLIWLFLNLQSWKYEVNPSSILWMNLWKMPSL